LNPELPALKHLKAATTALPQNNKLQQKSPQQKQNDCQVCQVCKQLFTQSQLYFNAEKETVKINQLNGNFYQSCDNR
jgi:hypothetical protein